MEDFFTTRPTTTHLSISVVYMYIQGFKHLAFYPVLSFYDDDESSSSSSSSCSEMGGEEGVSQGSSRVQLGDCDVDVPPPSFFTLLNRHTHT